MNYSDFTIGEEFFAATGRWRCTDIGTRVIIAIALKALDSSWYNGPPFVVAGSNGSPRPGRRFTAPNWSRIGRSCNPVSLPSRSNHSGSHMTHPIHHVASFSIVGPYTLALTFGDRTQQVIDFHPVLRGDLFGPLRDLTLFNQVRLDVEVGTLTWPNGADFDPATLHDWPNVRDAYIALAQSWTETFDEGRANLQMEPTRR